MENFLNHFHYIVLDCVLFDILWASEGVEPLNLRELSSQCYDTADLPFRPHSIQPWTVTGPIDIWPFAFPSLTGPLTGEYPLLPFFWSSISAFPSDPISEALTVIFALYIPRLLQETDWRRRFLLFVVQKRMPLQTFSIPLCDALVFFAEILRGRRKKWWKLVRSVINKGKRGRRRRGSKNHTNSKRVEWGRVGKFKGGRTTKRMLPHQRAAGADPP